MKRSILSLAVLIVMFLAASGVRSELVTEATIGSAYNGNLFNDSNSTGDSYSSFGLGFKYYPSSSVQFSANGMYNGYANYGDLSNLSGDFSAMAILTPESSPLSILLAGSVAARKFGLLYQLYDQVGATAGVDIGYRLSQKIHLQTSASILNNRYTNSDYGSNRGFDFAVGANFSFFGSNALAVRADYSQRLFDQPSLTSEESGNLSSSKKEESEPFEITGIMLRYSRPLGQQTGLNISFGHRRLHLDSDYAVRGYSIDYLSPWSDLWEGVSLSGGLKHFFPSQITTELSFSYFDKSYVDVIELEITEEVGETGTIIESNYWRDRRDDRLTNLSLSVSRPFALQNGKQITPLFNIGYRQNRSSNELYDYKDIMASISVQLGL